MATVLIIEDEVNIAAMIRTCIQSEGHHCQVVYDGKAGVDAFRQLQPDVVILDLMLPEMNGLDVCTHIRQSSKLGQKDPYIMMLTGKTEEIDRIIGFSTGADDYMAKPFNPVELTVRLRALLRRELRRHNAEPDDCLETTHLEINQGMRSVHLKLPNGDREGVKFTTLEFNLLVTMAQRPGRVWSRSQLLDMVWGDDFDGDDRIVDSYIKRLRQKLCNNDRFEKSQFIHTASGIGYSFLDSSEIAS